MPGPRTCSGCVHYAADFHPGLGSYNSERLWPEDEATAGLCERSTPKHRVSPAATCPLHSRPGEFGLLRMLRPWRTIRELEDAAQILLDAKATACDDRAVLRSLSATMWADLRSARELLHAAVPRSLLLQFNPAATWICHALSAAEGYYNLSAFDGVFTAPLPRGIPADPVRDLEQNCEPVR